MLAGEPAREDDRDHSVGADDVAGEEDAVHGAEQDHPPAATAHQAAGVDRGLLACPGQFCRRRFAPLRGAWQRLQICLRAGFDAPVDHGGQTEAEEHGEQRNGSFVHQEGADEDPYGVRRREGCG